MTWLQSLPHQIPFRAASAAVRVADDTMEGTFICTADDPLPFSILAVEAMAQLAGGLAFHDREPASEERGGDSGPDSRPSSSGPPTHAFLSGLDGVTLDRPIEPGEVVRFRVTMNASFGSIFRFAGSGTVDGVEVIRGKFYLASPESVSS
jgi:3-hydroxymyristoyl/3-hydroxydecanoyl-(acyl carrier protein) dehydratase